MAEVSIAVGRYDAGEHLTYRIDDCPNVRAAAWRRRALVFGASWASIEDKSQSHGVAYNPLEPPAEAEAESDGGYADG